MNRIKRHRVKQENAPAPSSSHRASEEHDLAYYIHDRVELMHQVFSVLKSKELKALAPECVRQLSIDDLQELCLEELLGISSKRLCAILDGAEPPSDTESSSQSEHLETISLDSISSDDEILSQGSKKKKHKHRHGKKKRKRKSKDSDSDAGETRASRAGLTVLELLELQARARAIRAQLHQEPPIQRSPGLPSEAAPEPPSSDNEVEIKEEPAEVVEISSDEEKPNVERLAKQISTTASPNETEANKNENTQTVTKKINDLIITVPQAKPTRKIRLKRSKPTENASTEVSTAGNVEKTEAETKNVEETSKNNGNREVTVEVSNDKPKTKEKKAKEKKTKKKKKNDKKNEGSDQDEITIQLSDSEKMDLLEDLDAKNFDNVSSSNSDSSDDDDNNVGEKESKNNDSKLDTAKDKNDDSKIDNAKEKNDKDTEAETVTESKTEDANEVAPIETEIRGYISKDSDGTVEMSDLPVVVDDVVTSEQAASNDIKEHEVTENADEKENDANEQEKTSEEKTDNTINEKVKSDGELSDRESSEVETTDVQPEVVCISDDEGRKKKKKKKDKKSKKEKKRSGFREGDDSNFYKDEAKADSNVTELTIEDDDDVYEILEISDDSSCYEVEGVSVLSKEPTAEEIEAFSARMDTIEIERDAAVIPNESETTESTETSAAENVSWKDRYLGSKKVKRVLTTANILNAIRKKNIELKKKLEEVKKADKQEKESEEVKDDAEKPATMEDGSIEQYNTLEGSTKYVDPVIDKEVGDNEAGVNETEDKKEEGSEVVTKEMKKDAKMLLKMYKRLLKYNDINKQKDPNKKKKKKQKKSKDKDKGKISESV